MKKILFKPGFEFIFALSLLAIFALPPVLLAQTQKDVEIKIENGDTTINGKNIRLLSPDDRKSALNHINHIGNMMPPDLKDGETRVKRRQYLYERRDSAGNKTRPGDFLHKKQGTDAMITERVIVDSLGNTLTIRQGKPRVTDRKLNFKYRMDEDRAEMRGAGPERMHRLPGLWNEGRNSQQFNYDIVDNDGMSTYVGFRITDVSDDDLKRMPHVEGDKFEISDINIAPQFSTGKTMLLFNLPAKTASMVKLTDSEGKIIWSEKANGSSFSKSFVLGLNGIYYLQVKQGRNMAVKRIVKE